VWAANVPDAAATGGDTPENGPSLSFGRRPIIGIVILLEKVVKGSRTARRQAAVKG